MGEQGEELIFSAVRFVPVTDSLRQQTLHLLLSTQIARHGADA